MEQRLILRGIWLILKLILKTSRYLPGTAEAIWCSDVAGYLHDPKQEWYL